MAIKNIKELQIGTVGFPISQWLIETDDTLAEVTASGYLNEVQRTYQFGTKDFATVYTTDFNDLYMQISISADNSTVSLVNPYEQSGSGVSFTGSLVSGNIPKFNGTSGVIADAGIASDEIMQTSGANSMAAGSSIVLAKVNGTEDSNAVTASGVSGILTTSSLTTEGGSSYSITWTNTFITATSVILLSAQGGTNTTENITMKVTAGSGSATLVIYNNTAATALDGTLLIGYAVL